MLDFIFAVIFLALALGGITIRKTYYYLPLTELKRRAARRDSPDLVARQLYRAAAYQTSLRGILWLFIAVTSAAGFVLLARVAPVWLSLILVVALLWVAFSWLPASRVTAVGTRLTSLVTPPLVWLLEHLHPALDRSVSFVQKRYNAPVHTGLFEREDVLALLDQQQSQPDSRLTVEEIDIIKHVLKFEDYMIQDILTPRSSVRTVHANETVGPILIDELHQTGFDYVLVQDSASKGNVVGILAVNLLGLQSTGHVRDLMDDTVYYVHENDNLSDALHAFFVTNHPLFVVVNSAENYVGIITVQNIVRKLIGHIPGDDFDQYSDLSAVAARHSQPRQTKSGQKTEHSINDDVIEVLE